MCRVFLLLLLFSTPLYAQWRIEGRVGDASGTLNLEYASVQCTGRRVAAAITDSTGWFTLQELPAGEYILEVRHLGYQPWRDTIRITGNVRMTVAMQPAGQELQEVTITQNRLRMQPANVRLSYEDITQRASMLGEANIYEALQQQAGIIHTGELNPGLYVRGMSAGHTGVFVDGMNTLAGNHLLSIYPPFNADAFAGMRLLKEDISAQYGGFLASYLLLETGDAMHEKFAGNAEIGILTSKLSLEVPVVHDRVSWTANVRRSYFDLIANSYNHINRNDAEYLPLPTYGFYDVNNSVQIHTGKRSRLKLTTLFTGDQFDMNGRMIEMSGKWSDQLATATWIWYPTDRLRGQLRAGWNSYHASMLYPESVQREMDNRVREMMLQGDVNWVVSPSWQLNAGMFVRRHGLSVQAVSTLDTIVVDQHRFDRTTFDWGGYADVTFSPGDIFRFKAGFRADYYRSDIQKTYLSPMISASVAVVGGTALLSARKQVQFAHLYVPLGIQLPVNIWYPSDNLSPPEEAWNFSFSYGRQLGKKMKANVAIYYIVLNKLVEFTHGNYFSSLDFSTDIGSGLSKGMEAGLSYRTSQWQADIQYTLGRSTCQFNQINNGNTYPLSYDIRHKLDFTLVWHWYPRWTLSLAQFVQSGFMITIPTGVYLHQEADLGDTRVQVVPIYSDRNNFRMPLSHRLDISVKHDFKIKSLDASWTAGLFNAYAYQNPYYVFFTKEEDAEGHTYLQMRTKSLLPLVPFISVKVNF